MGVGDPIIVSVETREERTWTVTSFAFIAAGVNPARKQRGWLSTRAMGRGRRSAVATNCGHSYAEQPAPQNGQGRAHAVPPNRPDRRPTGQTPYRKPLSVIKKEPGVCRRSFSAFFYRLEHRCRVRVEFRHARINMSARNHLKKFCFTDSPECRDRQIDRHKSHLTPPSSRAASPGSDGYRLRNRIRAQPDRPTLVVPDRNSPSRYCPDRPSRRPPSCETIR